MGNKKVEDQGKLIAELAELRYKKGYSRGSLVKYIMEKDDEICSGVKQARAYQLINIMFEEVGEVYNKLNSKVLEDTIESLESMRQSAMEQGMLRLALEMQKELDKIQQLHITKLEIDANINTEVPLFGPIKKEDKNKSNG